MAADEDQRRSRHAYYIGTSKLHHGLGIMAGGALPRRAGDVLFTAVVNVINDATADAYDSPTPDDHARIWWEADNDEREEDAYLVLRGHYGKANDAYYFNTITGNQKAAVFMEAELLTPATALITVKMTAAGTRVPPGAELLWDYALCKSFFPPLP